MGGVPTDHPLFSALVFLCANYDRAGHFVCEDTVTASFSVVLPDFRFHDYQHLVRKYTLQQLDDDEETDGAPTAVSLYGWLILLRHVSCDDDEVQSFTAKLLHLMQEFRDSTGEATDPVLVYASTCFTATMKLYRVTGLPSPAMIFTVSLTPIHSDEDEFYCPMAIRGLGHKKRKRASRAAVESATSESVPEPASEPPSLPPKKRVRLSTEHYIRLWTLQGGSHEFRQKVLAKLSSKGTQYKLRDFWHFQYNSYSYATMTINFATMDKRAVEYRDDNIWLSFSGLLEWMRFRNIEVIVNTVRELQKEFGKGGLVEAEAEAEPEAGAEAEDDDESAESVLLSRRSRRSIAMQAQLEDDSCSGVLADAPPEPSTDLIESLVPLPTEPDSSSLSLSPTLMEVDSLVRMPMPPQPSSSFSSPSPIPPTAVTTLPGGGNEEASDPDSWMVVDEPCTSPGDCPTDSEEEEDDTFSSAVVTSSTRPSVVVAPSVEVAEPVVDIESYHSPSPVTMQAELEPTGEGVESDVVESIIREETVSQPVSVPIASSPTSKESSMSEMTEDKVKKILVMLDERILEAMKRELAGEELPVYIVDDDFITLGWGKEQLQNGRIAFRREIRDKTQYKVTPSHVMKGVG
jgi:hypothetical protein